MKYALLYTSLLVLNCYAGTTKPSNVFIAIKEENQQAVTAIFKKDPKVLLQRNEGNNTPLGLASQMANLDMTKLLIQLGADVNGTTGPENAPAIFYHGKEMTALFLSNGANINIQNSSGETLLIIKAGTEGEEDGEVIKYLLEQKADPNMKTKNGRTALHYAVSSAIVKVLVTKGADVNAKDSEGNTPLMTNLKNNNESAKIPVAKALLELGAAVNIENLAGQTALDLATPRQEVEVNSSKADRAFNQRILELLLKFGAKTGVSKG